MVVMDATFGEVLRNLLAERIHVSRAQVAANAGVALTTVYNLLNDEPVRFSNTVAILKALVPALTDSEIEVAALALGKSPSFLEALLREPDSSVQGDMVALAPRPSREPRDAGSGMDQPRDPTVRIDVPGQPTRTLEHLTGELIERLGVRGAESVLAGLLHPMREAHRRAIFRTGLGDPDTPPSSPTSAPIEPPVLTKPLSPEQKQTPDGTPYVERQHIVAPAKPGAVPKTPQQLAGEHLARQAIKKAKKKA